MNFINGLFGSILSAFNSFTGHYVLALFLFALMLKVILLPFGIKQQKNSVKQARFKPKEMAIRNKYKGRTDQPTQQKMQNEIMELYQSEGYSPLGGCLPMLIQLPIIFILYNIVYNPLKYISDYSAEMLNGIATFITDKLGGTLVGFADGVFKGRDIDLVQYLTETNVPAINEFLGETGKVAISELPNFGLFGDPTALSKLPSFASWLVLIPLLNFAFTILSSLITRKLTFQPMQDNAQAGKSMMITTVLMSLVTMFFVFRFPAALGIYWIFNTVLGVLQQFILYKAIPLPKFTEADYKAAEREYAGKISQKEYSKRTRVVHDTPTEEDEYADLGTYSSIYDEREAEAREAREQSPSGIEQAPMKGKKNNKQK